MDRHKKVDAICAKCSKHFLATMSELKRGRAKCCSRSCSFSFNNPSATRDLKGCANPNWKGGLTKSKKGYWYVKKPDHPRAMKNGYVKRADLVLEGKIGRPLVEGEEAHHKNLKRDDDSPDNLQLVTKEEHCRLHGDMKIASNKNKGTVAKLAQQCAFNA